MARGAKRTAVEAGPVEGPWELPDGWRWERLGDLGDWYGGGTPSKSNPTFWTDGTVPWVSAKDMKFDYIDDTDDHITDAAVEGSSAKRIPAGSVLCVMRSGILRHSFPVAVTGREVTINQDLRALKPRANINPVFLAHFLKRTERDVLHECSKDGTTVNSIDTGRLMGRVVPIPSRDVQDRIVIRVGELFAEIDEGVGTLAAAQTNIATYRDALIASAMTGRLTEGWRRERPSAGSSEESAWLQVARQTSARGQGATFDRNAAVQGPWELPASWRWVSVAQLGEVVTGNTPPDAARDSFGGGLPFFTPGDLFHGQRVSQTKRTLTRAGLSKVRAIPSGSVMVTCIGATIGKTSLSTVDGSTNQQINSIVPSVPALAEFLLAYFSGPQGRASVIDASSSTTMPILNKGDFSRLPVPLPPLGEVHEIVRRLRSQRSLEEEAAPVVARAAAASTSLRQSILAAAFRGDLVA